MIKFTKSLRSISRALPSIQFKSIKTMVPAYESLESVTLELRGALEEELKHSPSNEETEQYLKEFLTDFSWSLTSSPDSTRMELIKISDGVLIKVIFSAKSPEPFDSSYPVEDADPSGTDEDQESQYTEFFVVLDNGTPAKIVIDMMIINGELSINGAFSSKDPNSIIDGILGERRTWQYIGPNFEILSEAMQAVLVGYVHSIGINSDLSDFITESSIHQEAQQTHNLLSQLKSFLE